MNKDTQKWRGQIHDKQWELQKLSDRVKLFSESYEYHYRFDLIEWEIIRRQFVDKINDQRAQ